MDYIQNPNYYLDGTRYKYKYICTDCGKCFKRKILGDISGDKHSNETDHKCPDCGKPTAWIGPKFRPPKSDNIKAWKSIKILNDLGQLHFIGWAGTSFDIPETTKALNDFLKSLKANYEWNIKKWTSNEYSPDNKTQIKHFSEAIKKIDKYLQAK